MIWEFWGHLEGPGGTVRAPFINTETKEPIEFEGELAEAMIIANSIIHKYNDATLVKIVGMEILPKGRGKYLTYPSDEKGRMEIDQN